MDEEADAVADVVVFVAFVFRAFQYVHLGLVNVVAHCAGLGDLVARIEHLLHQVIDFPLFGGGLAHHYGPGHVGHVSVNLAAEIHQNEVTVR